MTFRIRPEEATVWGLAVLLTAGLWQQGMFMDGVYYATVARNLAEGDGTFWNMHFTRTLHADFYDQPPLAIFLQSLWFRVFGDSLYVERAYSFTVFVLQTALIYRLWNLIVPDPRWKRWAWVPLLFWLSVYSITWAVRNNMLENTMMLFVYAAAWSIFKSRDTRKWAYLTLAGLCVFGAFLCKGPASLYVLVLPVVLGVFRLYPSKSSGVAESAYLVLCVVVTGLVIVAVSPGAYRFFGEYYKIQFLRSVLELKNVDSRTYIVQRYVAELGYALGLTALLLLIAKIKKIPVGLGNTRMMTASVLFALCGVLPIMASWRQRTYYVNSTFIWVCFAMAMAVLPLLVRWGETVGRSVWLRKTAWVLTGCVWTAGIAVSVYTVRWGGRDKVLLHDVERITEQFPPGTVFHTDTELYFDWPNPAYLYRLGHISLTDREQSRWEYSTRDSVPGYRRVSEGTRKFHVFEKKE